MSRSTYDYDMLEREYVSTDISVRALAEKHQIKAWSSVNAQKNKREWDRKRAEFKAKFNDRQIETMVDQRIAMVATIHGELLLAVRAAVHRFVKDVQAEENAQHVSARDLMGMIDKFLLLTGQPTSRSESHLDVSDFGGILRGAPPELLRELADVARSNGAGGQPVGRGPLIVLEGTRTA